MDKKIKRLISYYKRMVGTNDPFKIASFLGIQVFFGPLGDALGMYKYLEHTKCIFINSAVLDNELLTRIVMAHELGHAALQWKENCCFMAHKTLLLTSKVELDANTFAAELLITDDLLMEFQGCTVEQFSNCTGIDKDLISLRLRNLK